MANGEAQTPHPAGKQTPPPAAAVVESPNDVPVQLWDGEQALLEAETEGYNKSLKRRHIQMIAVGGAIGTGLFLGAGGRLNSAGPALVLVYAVCGVAVFFVLRALGELVVHRPTSGSFVSYAREFMGEKGAFVAGWMYFLLWACAGIADITAVAVYAKYWQAFADVPQWVIALFALICVVAANLISAKLFGEIEFWAAIIKVVAIVAFMAIALYVLGTRTPVDGEIPGLSLIAENGGMFPHGLLAAVIIVPGVVFAYSSLELVSIAAGETENPEKIVPKATNAVIYRVGIFYCGSVLLLALVMPWTAYSANESPFVTFLSSIGVPYAGGVMNFVVLTAALSSVNSGLYATGRILRSMSVSGSAPDFVGRMNRRKVPAGGIVFVACAYLVGIGLNAVVPDDAFEIVLNFAALGILSTWMFVLVSHLVFLQRVKSDPTVTRPSFRMPGAPYTNYVTIVFLISVVVLMWFDVPVGRITVIAIIPIGIALIVGWHLAKGKIAATAASFDTAASTRNDAARSSDPLPAPTAQADATAAAEPRETASRDAERDEPIA